jgi:hypothetical protein
MKLYSLIKRITEKLTSHCINYFTTLFPATDKKNWQKLRAASSLLVLGATIFLTLGGFFYPNFHSVALSNDKIITKTPTPSTIISTASTTNTPPQALTTTITNSQSKIPPKINLSKINKSVEIKLPAQEKTSPLKDSVTRILIGTPMEEMIEPISKQDKIVAAFLVGIALKESGFGKHKPVLNGQDCFNYWGYRGKRKRMGTGGHTCFDSPEDAVETVAKRIHTLAIKQKRNTPNKMLIWKCGNSCTSHSPASVTKWIQDVSIYFNKIINS